MVISRDTYKLTPDQARDLAREFGNQSGVSQSLIDSMNTDINHMQQMINTLGTRVQGMDWSGWSALQFDNDWNGEFRPAMQRMQQAMQEFVPVLSRLRDGLADTQGYLDRRATATEQLDRAGAH